MGILPWIQCSNYCPRVWKATSPRDKSYRSKHKNISPSLMEAKYRICDSRQFLCAFLKQLAVSLAKVGSGYFQNLFDVLTDVYHNTDVELLSKREFFASTISTVSRGSINPLYRHERPSSTSSKTWSALKRTTHMLCTCRTTFCFRD